MGFPTIRKMFSNDPLYYHPAFSAKMSGRRFEQILRCFSCNADDVDQDRLHKVNPLLRMLLKNFQRALNPEMNLSLDESLLLFRGRLSFRQYIKGKNARYGIKFYELCTPGGYVINIDIYKGKSIHLDPQNSKIDSLVFHLMEPYLNKGHHLFMDNFYNSVSLCNKLLEKKTHTTGTLRSNRKENPKEVTGAKLKRGEYEWRRKGKVYVTKWKDKRDVLSISTKYHPQMLETTNRYGKSKQKPLDISNYNNNMSGVDRLDQMIAYYSCPRKSIRWYKKVIFHLLDVAICNAHYLYKIKVNPKCTLLEFREILIKNLLGISTEVQDGRSLVKSGAIHGGKRKILVTPDAKTSHYQEKFLFLKVVLKKCTIYAVNSAVRKR